MEKLYTPKGYAIRIHNLGHCWEVGTNDNDYGYVRSFHPSKEAAIEKMKDVANIHPELQKVSPTITGMPNPKTLIGYRKSSTWMYRFCPKDLKLRHRSKTSIFAL